MGNDDDDDYDVAADDDSKINNANVWDEELSFIYIIYIRSKSLLLLSQRCSRCAPLPSSGICRSG